MQAFEQDLAIVPVLNKVDLPSAEPERVAEQMQQVRHGSQDLSHLAASSAPEVAGQADAAGAAGPLA